MQNGTKQQLLMNSDQCVHDVNELSPVQTSCIYYIYLSIPNTL